LATDKIRRPKTGKQLYFYNSSAYSDELTFQTSTLNVSDWGTKVRAMRREPTIRLVRGAAVAPPMMTTWSVEGDVGVPEEVIRATNDWIQLHRTHLIRTGLTGMIDWGWQGYEKVWGYKDGEQSVVRFKPLLQDLTEIRITNEGSFNGFKQATVDTTTEVQLDRKYSLLFNTGVEGQYHYGEADMFAAEQTYDDKQLVNESAKRYDQKVAGAHWIVHYPIGSSLRGGEEIDNYDIAIEILDSLESSGRMAVPRKLSGQLTGLDAKSAKQIDAWEIELITAYGSQVPFNDRMMYLDNLLVRAFGFPERSILQGQFGTKAEAGEHGTFALVNVQLRHEHLVEQLNWHAVNQYLSVNYGQGLYENKVRVVVAPLADFQQQMLKDLYTRILQDPRGFAEEVPNLNMTTLRDKLNIPTHDGANKALEILVEEMTGKEPTE